jgi:hypothetical protein
MASASACTSSAVVSVARQRSRVRSRAALESGDRASGSTASTTQRRDLADAGAGSEHEVDDVGQVAGGPRPGLAWCRPLPAADRGANGLQVFEGERDNPAARPAQSAGVAYRVGRDRAVTHGQGEHLTENDLGALGRRRVIFGDGSQELVQAANAGLPDAQTAQGGQDRRAQAGLVAVDGLWCEAFLAGSLEVAGPPKALDLHLICDNYGTHKTPQIHQWLVKHPGSTCVSPRPTRPGSTSWNGVRRADQPQTAPIHASQRRRARSRCRRQDRRLERRPETLWVDENRRRDPCQPRPLPHPN